MKRILFLLLCAVCIATTTAVAQSTTTEFDYGNLTISDDEDYGRRIVINKFSENWEIGAKVGTQAYLGEYVTCGPPFAFKDWWTLPAFDFNIAKWGTHSIGMNLGLTLSPFKSLYMATSEYESTHATFCSPYDKVYAPDFNVATGHMGNLYLQAIFDLGNMFFGYDPDRFYTIVASVGGGLMTPLGSVKYRDICSSFNAGLTSKFRLSKHLFLDVAVRGTLHDDMFNGISYFTSDDIFNISVDATIGATVGLSYRFNFSKQKTIVDGKRVNPEGWHSVNELVPHTDAYKEVQSDLSEAKEEIEETSAELADAKTKLAQASKTVKRQPLYYRQLVNFVVDTWTLSNREKASVQLAAEFIKQYPDKKFLVKGYADVQTATPEHNQMLSENRAQTVYDCLVNEFGINPAQLQKSSYGGVDYMFFNDKQCSRSVIICSIEKE